MRKIGRANGPLHRLCLVKNVRRRKEHAGTKNVGSCSFEERPFLAGIERLIRKHLHVVEDHPYRSDRNPGPPTDLDPRRANGVPVLSMIRSDELFRPGRIDAFPGRSDGRPGRSRRESKWGAGFGNGKPGNRGSERRSEGR